MDAIVIVGAEPKTDGLDGMATLVTEDVYDNLKVNEELKLNFPLQRAFDVLQGLSEVLGGSSGEEKKAYRLWLFRVSSHSGQNFPLWKISLTNSYY